eukprot:3621549-Alexandrium_andersonii.AAC.1
MHRPSCEQETLQQTQSGALRNSCAKIFVPPIGQYQQLHRRGLYECALERSATSRQPALELG